MIAGRHPDLVNVITLLHDDVDDDHADDHDDDVDDDHDDDNQV